MDRRYWAVLKVVLVRPWTKLMAGIWVLCMFGVLSPLQNLDNFRQPTIAIPDFDQPGIAILEMSDLRRFKGDTGKELSDVETLDSAALPDTSISIVNGDSARTTAGTSVAGTWPVLEQLPQLKSLRIQPQHVINAEGWERIGQLSQLESLWVQNASPESANKREDAIESADRALSQLPHLRQINVANSSFSNLPPMPNLEYAVLDCSRSLEQNLKTLADHSPKLRELALQPYTGFQLTSSMRESLTRMPALRTIWIWSGVKSETDVLTPQLASLRASLPQINVRRGEYSRLRSNSVFIAFGIIVWPGLIFFVHGMLMQSLPLAAYLPGHRRPHLLWPLLCACLICVCFTLVCSYFGVAWYAAAAIGVSYVFFSNSWGSQSSRWLRLAFKTAHVILFAAVLLSVASPLLAEEFLAGEFPTLTAGVLAFGGVLFVLCVAASTQRHRIWTEKGSPPIPGLQFSQNNAGAALSSREQSWLSSLMCIQDAFTTRRLLRSRSQDFTTKLVAAATGNTGRIVGAIFMFLALVGVRQFVMPTRNESLTPLYAFALFQGSLMSLMLTATTWFGRRSSLALDLLRPVSREQFWRSVRIGVLRDMLPTVFLTMVGAFAMIWAEQRPSFAAWGVLCPIILLSGLGVLLILHALVVWVITSDRLWLTATVSVAVLVVVASMAVPTVPLTLTQGTGGTGIAVWLSGLLIAGGIVAQLALARILPQKELGLISM